MEDTNLVRGATACVSSTDGAIVAGGDQGLYHRDVRVLSGLRTVLAGARLAASTGRRTGPSAATWLRVLGDAADGVLVRHGRQVVDGGLVDTFVVEVTAGGLRDAVLRVSADADFAETTALRAGVPAPDDADWAIVGPATLRAERGRVAVEVALAAEGARVDDDGVLSAPVIASRGTPWTATLRVLATADLAGDVPGDVPRAVRVPGGAGGAGAIAGGAGDAAATVAVAPLPAVAGGVEAAGGGGVTRGDGVGWRGAGGLRVAGGGPWAAATASALADLAALQVGVPELGLSYVAAGAPWYLALFGRDSMIAASFLLPAGQAVGLDVLRTLARFQGRRDDPRTLEQPGRILHELRTGAAGVFGLPPFVPYYGAIDASALFVVLLADLHRWGAPDREVRDLLPAARAALDWCATPGDIDGDGFLEYVPDERGLADQGWKDGSGVVGGGPMVHADGSRATGPIAVAEAQGYHHAALLGLAALEERVGDPGAAPALRARAGALADAFAAAFWLPDRGLLAMALDGDKRPLAVASSNPGHCLWTGILPADIAAQVARRLAQPDLRTAWGLRTLGSAEVAYDPLSYHRGSIWPHDTAIAAAGMARAGEPGPALRLAEGLLRVSAETGWRLPELYGGLDDADVPFPVPLPVACSPQAWSAAAPLSLLRTVLGLEPDVPAGEVAVAPILPAGARLAVTGIALGDATLNLVVEGDRIVDADVPPGLSLRPGPPAG